MGTPGSGAEAGGFFRRLFGGRRSGVVPAEEAVEEEPRLLVVVADDDPDLLGLISRRLPKRGYDLVTATHGGEALEAVRRHLPVAAVIDWNMPVMEGPEVCALLKADPRTAGIPLVLLTARGTEEEIEEAFEQGADEYVNKPFDIIDLDETIRRVIEEKKGAEKDP